ncbi:hypothetical protein BT96DRAFT_937119 [Gymnopus androsaceus JB14]|uniref:Uncharacterized protein n=1 Tax=Gymnopus androsaceus JB14 TaxID=1447944 RepID=A0A6A4I0I3_9AGAR|nr:hypothetical protein BT96DRAFT_937119 [Gymnopus androsaceus JB14]
MANDPPTFLQLARELRDQIYENALLTTVATPPESILPCLVDASGPRTDSVRWRLTPNRGSCFGLMHSCRQIYTEMIESIKRDNGLSFELDLVVLKTPSSPDEDSWYRAPEEIWPEWVVLPIFSYYNPKVQSNASSPAITDSTCRSLRVSFRIQSQLRLWWWATGGPAPLTQTLFSMLAKFLLHGPLGLHMKSSQSSDSTWNIDTLSVDIVGVGKTYTNPYDSQIYTVPIEVVEDTEEGLGVYFMEKVCSSGALSGRVRVVRLLVDGEVKRECVIDQETSLSADTKSTWAYYGWIIE